VKNGTGGTSQRPPEISPAPSRAEDRGLIPFATSQRRILQRTRSSSCVRAAIGIRSSWIDQFLTNGAVNGQSLSKLVSAIRSQQPAAAQVGEWERGWESSPLLAEFGGCLLSTNASKQEERSMRMSTRTTACKRIYPGWREFMVGFPIVPCRQKHRHCILDGSRDVGLGG
jgi:hypothetical protein